MSARSSDQWIKCISQSGTLRGVSLDVSELAAELCRLHQLQNEPAVALTEALMSGLLLASFCKIGERINLNITGDKQFKQTLVDAYPEGHVRGYVTLNSQYDPKSNKEPEKIELGEGLLLSLEERQTGPWGSGLLSILRTKTLENKQPYIGTVPLLTGYLAKDLTYYWLQSEQIPSCVGLQVNLKPDGSIDTAGAFMVQALPGVTEDELELIENQISKMAPKLAQAVAAKEDPLILLSTLFQDKAFQILEKKELTFKCQCSWERVERALLLTGKAELQAIKDGPAEAIVICDFCTKEYRADQLRLEKMIQSLT